MKTKRPTFLTIWLILMTIGNAGTFLEYTFGAAMLARTMPFLPSWGLPVLSLFGLVNIIAVVMLWMWKKIGFYMVVGSAILVAAINGTLLGVAGISGAVGAIIGLGILYLAMKPVWKSFK